MLHTLIFVPSYFDFVRVRNWMTKTDVDFQEISEYTLAKTTAKARDHFFHGECHFLLYTERAHFYKRYNLKGVRHLVFYQIPQYAEFFAEIANFVMPGLQNKKSGSADNLSVTVLFDKYDGARLAEVLGTERAQQMVTGQKSVHLVQTG